MNIFQATKIIGHIPVVQGFWKNVMIVVGLIGSIIMLPIIILGGLQNWLTISLMLFFIAINSLGLYITFECVYSCRDAKQDIDRFFSHSWQENNKILFNALNHMTKGTTTQTHNVSCRKCWDYYMDMKRKHCGG